MRSKRNRRRAILADEPEEIAAAALTKLVRFGTPRREADRCTLSDAPAQFAICMDCRYNHGAEGSGIRCAHRFGLDPTLVDGQATQFRGGHILPLDE